jgi:hypothetical protein
MKKYMVNSEHPVIKERGLSTLKVSDEEVKNFEYIDTKLLFGTIEVACFFNSIDNDTYYQKLDWANEVKEEIIIENKVAPALMQIKISDEDIVEIFNQRFGENKHVKDIAKDYGISTAYVYMLTTAKQRKEITQPLLEKYRPSASKQKTLLRNKTSSQNDNIDDDFGDDFLTAKIRKIIKQEIKQFLKKDLKEFLD